MIDPVTFTVPGDPQGKAVTRAKGRQHFKAPKTRAYELAVGTMARLAMRSRPPIDECVTMDMRAVFAIPASWSEKKRASALLGEIAPGVKPDLSNIAKAIEDGMKGIVLTDDARIVKYGLCEKVYGLNPVVVVTVRDRRSVRNIV